MGEVVAEDDLYTKDGTVDFRNNPAKRNETGTWKACPFILGTLKLKKKNPFFRTLFECFWFKNKKF